MDSNAMETEVPAGYELLRNQSGFSDMIGPFYVREPADGHGFAMGFRVGPKHINQGGVVHGGMLVSFVDNALGALVFRATGNKPCSTISLDCNFVAPGRPGDWIECSGEIGRVTSTLVFLDGRVRAGDRVLMQAKGIWKVLDKWLGEKTG